MTAPPPAPKYEPLTPVRASLRWVAVLLGALVGSLEIYLGYLALAPRLPGAIPTHYNAQGVADAFGSPWQFVVGALATEVVVGGAMAAVFASVGGDVPVWKRHARSALDPVAGLMIVALVGMLPLIFVGALLQAANAWPVPLLAAWQLGLALFLVAAAVTAVVATRRARAAPRDPADAFGTVFRYRGAQRGPIFLCTSCGNRHVRSAWWLLTPRIGVSAVEGGASYYLRCPVCGEVGWSPRVGWLNGGPTDSDPPATHA